jgi:hypothetical protein
MLLAQLFADYFQFWVLMLNMHESLQTGALLPTEYNWVPSFVTN